MLCCFKGKTPISKTVITTVLLLYMYKTVTLHLGTVVLNRSTPCSPGKPFQPTRADPDQPDTSRPPSLQCETGLLTSGLLVGSLGHYSRQLHLKTGDSIKICFLKDIGVCA